MQKRTLGKTGLEVSALGFGGAPVGYLETDRRQATEILNTLLDRGVNLIDTAASYAGSEEVIGQAIGQRRDEYVLVSKCGQAFDDIEGEAWSAAAIGQTVDRALRRLKTDHLDVMLLHSCGIETLKTGEAIGALAHALEAGKVRYAGYSGDNEAAAYAAQLDVVSVIETSVSICDQANIDAVLPETRRNDIGVLAKRPIDNAAWKDPSEQPGIYAGYARTYTERLAKMGITPEELGFEGAGSEAWPELALRFTLSHPGVSTAIVGTTKLASVEDNIAAAAKGPLSVDVVTALRQAFQRAEAAAGEKWTGQT